MGRLRQQSRVLVDTNSYADGLLGNLTNYVIGKGFSYKATTKEDAPDADPDKVGKQDSKALRNLVAATQDVIDQFLRLNRWNAVANPFADEVIAATREQETYRRVKRDGEAFVRLFFLDNGTTLTRWIEPEQVTNPPGLTHRDGWTYGIQHVMEPFEDVERRVAYWAQYQDLTVPHGRDNPQGEEVPASEVVHIRDRNTDANVKRGKPFFSFDVLDALRRASKLQRNNSLGAAIRAATAEIWKHETATRAEVGTFADSRADYQVTSPVTGRTENVEYTPPGTIRRIPAGQEPVFLPESSGAAEHLQVAQGDLRQAASAACAPEYMVGSNAENADYSSTKEAGAPFVRNAESEQEHFKAAFLAVVWRAVRWAVECGLLPRQALTLIEIQVEAPAVLHRNELEKAQADQIKVQGGWKSPQTCAMEDGLDPEIEFVNIEQHQERFGQQQAPLPMPGDEEDGDAGVLGGRPDDEPPGPVQESRLQEGAPESTAEDDPAAAAELLADIFYGLYGDDALEMVKGGSEGEVRESLLLEAWNEIDHPRGKGGRFIPKGSAEAQAAAKEVIGKVLKGDRSVGSAEKVLQHLSILTVKQLQGLHKEHGEKAPGKLRQQLVDGIKARLEAGKGKQEPKAPSLAEPHKMTRADYVDAAIKMAPADKQAEAKLAAAKAHKFEVKRALAAGDFVPPEVLADYPDLAEKTKPASTAPSKAQAMAKAFKDKLTTAAGLSDEQRQSYGAAFDRVFGRMTDQALKHVAEGAAKVSFYANGLDLSKDVAQRSEKARAARSKGLLVGGAYRPSEKRLFLDGPNTNPDMNPGIKAGADKNTHGAYAHELTHAIDGPDKKFSGSQEWFSAWGDEVAHPVSRGEVTLTRYAASSASEGFAEFGRLLYGSDADPAEVRKRFPRCAAFFERNGLWR